MLRPKGRLNRKRSVCMLVSNDMLNDPRVTRHAEKLGSLGFDKDAESNEVSVR